MLSPFLRRPARPPSHRDNRLATRGAYHNRDEERHGDAVFIDQPAHAAALSSLLAAGRRQLSLVDCTSFDVMRRGHISQPFAYDRHFGGQGFSLISAAG